RRREVGLTEIRLVVDRALLGEDPLQSLPVEVDELVVLSVDAGGGTVQALRIQPLQRGIDLRLPARGLERRPPPPVAARAGPSPALLDDRRQIGRDRILVVRELRRANHLPVVGRLGEAMEHEYAATETVRPDLEARPEARERILTSWPRGARGVELQ